MGNDPKLWHSLEFCYRSELSLYHMARTVSHRSHQIRSITLKNFSSPNTMDKMMWTIGNNCSRLKQARISPYTVILTKSLPRMNANVALQLQLQNCSLRSETLMRLGMTCPRIESLSLICCDENYRKSHYTKAYMKVH